MNLIDFKIDPLYKAKTKPEVIHVPKIHFVMVDGEGPPNTLKGSDNDFQKAMEILYGIVYTIKFWDKDHSCPPGYAQFTMAPVEALWWTKSGQEFDLKKPEDWKWTAMIRIPQFVKPEFFNKVVQECVDKKDSEDFRQARLESFHEGTCIQILHIGPYNKEQPTIERLNNFAVENDYKLTGKHHELYLGDPRRAAADKLKTILRHPVRKI